MPSIAQSCNVLPTGHGKPMQQALEALRADLAASRAEVVKLVTDIATVRTAYNALIAKLNLDAGVTDADYAAIAALTAAAPAAMTATA